MFKFKRLLQCDNKADVLSCREARRIKVNSKKSISEGFPHCYQALECTCPADCFWLLDRLLNEGQDLTHYLFEKLTLINSPE